MFASLFVSMGSGDGSLMALTIRFLGAGRGQQRTAKTKYAFVSDGGEDTALCSPGSSASPAGQTNSVAALAALAVAAAAALFFTFPQRTDRQKHDAAQYGQNNQVAKH